MPNDVERAGQIVAELRFKRDALVAHGIELNEQRQQVSYAAHTGDAAARKKLDNINREAALHDSERRSLDAAISEAAARVSQAQAAEAREQDRANALALREELQMFCQHAMGLDEAFTKIVEVAPALQESLSKMHSLGCDFPSHEQLGVLGYNCVLTALRQTPWDRRFDPIPPNLRRDFTTLVMGWHDKIEADIAARLGEFEQNAEAA
jgi:hypothetical protein